MTTRWQLLDQVLRGDATRTGNLASGELAVGARRLTPVLLALGGLYGLCMGSFGLIRVYSAEGLRDGAVGDAWWQLLATSVKVPLLFGATLLVTLPSLYVFNALVGSSLKARSVLRLLVAMLGVTLAVLASLGPIVAFFGVSTTSYPFMKLLNVVCFAVAGVLGLAFLLRTLHRLAVVQNLDETQHASDASGEALDENESDIEQPEASALMLVGNRTDRRAKAVFNIWVLVFALVGAQMSWVLRPFIGDPDLPFTWLRSRESNFFTDVLEALLRLIGA